MIIMYFSKPLDLTKKLVFIHTPKCGGTYTKTILSTLNIKNNGHNSKVDDRDESTTFTIIRHPVERFESLLNFRLGMKPLPDWPKHLLYVYDDPSLSLNTILSLMTDQEVLGFTPYRSLAYWTENADIIITLDKLHDMLTMFGYSYDKELFTPQNVSTKTRGVLDEQSKHRINVLFNDDIILYDKYTIF